MMYILKIFKKKKKKEIEEGSVSKKILRHTYKWPEREKREKKTKRKKKNTKSSRNEEKRIVKKRNKIDC